MTTLTFSGRLHAALDLPDATSREADALPLDELPLRPAEKALSQAPQEVSEVVSAQVQSGYTPSSPLILYSRKHRRGVRPLMLWSMPDRILLRALVALIEPHGHTLSRTAEAYTQFKSAPLRHESRWILQADIASFYEYVDHDFLHREIVSSTGDPELADSIALLLGFLLKRPFGLPQHHHTSDYLSEMLADIPERRLLRLGYDVWRYNDDFRVGASNYPAAAQAVEDLTDSLRSLGLLLNDFKTVIQSNTRYASWTQTFDTILSEAVTEADTDATSTPSLAFFDPYSPEGPSAASRSIADVAHRLLLRWSGRTLDDTEQAIAFQYLGAAFALLATLDDTRGLAFVPEALRREPSIAPDIFRYLSRLFPQVEEDVDATLRDLIQSDDLHLSTWHTYWLLTTFEHASALSIDQTDWIRSRFENSSHDIIRAQAAFILANFERISPRDIALITDTLDPLTTQDLVAALARSTQNPNHPLVVSLTRRSPLNRIIAQFHGSTD